MVAWQNASAQSVTELGQVMLGAVLSTLFTTKEHVLLPLASLAVNTTVVLPTPVSVVLAAGL